MPRSILILIVLLVIVLVGLFALAALDREVPTSRIEQPVANAAAH